MNPLLKRWWDHPKRSRYLLVFGIALLLYTVIGFLVVPAIIKAQLVKQLPSYTQRQAAVREVRFNPYALSLSVRGLELKEPSGEPFAGWEELYVNFQLSSLPRLAWTFDEITIREPRLLAVLFKNGTLNLANLGDTNPPTATPKPFKIPRVLIHDLTITNGVVSFEDLTRTTPFKTTYTPINLHLSRLSTKPDADAPLSFRAESDHGRSFAWAGNVTVQPLRSQGEFQVTGIDLPRFGPYAADFTMAQLTNGVVSFSGKYRVAQDSNRLDLVLNDFNMELKNLVFIDPETRDPVLKVGEYQLKDGRFDLAAREAGIGLFEVRDPYTLIRRLPDGSINLFTLMAGQLTPKANTNSAAPKTPSTGPPWVFSLDAYRVKEAEIVIRDQMLSPEFVTTLKPVNLEVTQFTTRTGSNALVKADLKTEAGEAVSVEGQYSFSPIQGRTAINVQTIHLPKYQPYAAQFFGGELRQGKTDARVEFSASYLQGKADVELTNTAVKVTGLDIALADETVIALAEFGLEGISASLSGKSAEVGAVRTRNGKILVRRNPDKTINLLTLLTPATNAASSATPAQEPAAAVGAGTPLDWGALIREVSLADYQVRLEDRGNPKPVDLVVDDLDVGVTNVCFPTNAPVLVDVAARLAAGGVLAAKGTLLPFTQQADLEVRVESLAIPPFQPYVEPHFRVQFGSGMIDLRGRAGLSGTNRTSEPFATFQGDLGITNVLLKDFTGGDLLSWTNLAVSGIDAKIEPHDITIKEVAQDGLSPTLIIGPDKRPVILDLVPPKPEGSTNAPAQPSPATGEGPLPFKLAVEQTVLRNGSLHFRDKSLDPACVFDVQEFGGTIKNFSTAPDSVAEIDIRGKVDDQAPFSLTGKANPLSSQLMIDLAFANTNLQLVSFSPYMEKYGGYPLNRGKVSTDLRYSVQETALKAENKVVVDQLMLGAKNESPDATKLPVKLGIALLKDANGQIALDVPLEGSIDDPQFAIAPMVGKVVMGIITKAVTAPFSLLGALVGGGGEEMSFVDFAPGAATIPENEVAKLDKLASALEKRPALSLEIAGQFDPASDQEALARLMSTHETIQSGATNQAAALLESAETPKTAKRGFFGKLFGRSGSSRKAAEAPRKQVESATQAPPEIAGAQAATTNTAAISEDLARELIRRRAEAVKAYILQTGKVAPERLFILPPKLDLKSTNAAPRVSLSLG